MRPNDGSRGVDDLALAAWLGERARGARVLFVGDASTGAADALARTAREVVANDARAIASRAMRGTLRVVRATGSPVPDGEGEFDLIVVPDLADALVTTREAMASLSRALAPGGAVVVSVASREAPVRLAQPRTPPPGDFRTLLADVFPNVRLFGQAPFVGYALADIAATAVSAIVFDGTMLGDDTELPERFVAVCRRDGETNGEPYTVVQLPAASALAGASVNAFAAREETTSEIARELGVVRDDLRAARERAEKLSRELEEERAAATRVKTDRPPAPPPPAPPPPDDGRVAELQAELRDALAGRQEERAQQKDRDETLQQRTAALAELDGEVERLRIEFSRVKEESETRVAALRTAREELETLRAAPAAPSDDFAALETSLSERAKRVLELEAEVERRGTLARDLTEEIARLSASGGVDEGALAEVERRAQEGLARAEQAKSELATLRSDRDAAVQRAVQAEAARVEAQFRADEAEGRLVGSRDGERAAAEALHLREAELAGAIRGLRARSAELEELRAGAEARLAVLQLDMIQSEQRGLQLERMLAEAREQFELELARATTAERATASRAPELQDRIAMLEGEKQGLRLRLADVEASLDAQLARLVGQEGERVALQNRAARAEREAASLRAALDEGKKVLRELSSLVAPGASAPRAASAFEDVDGGPEPQRDAGETAAMQKRMDVLLGEARDRDVLLRSLTAQLEERDDRLRALEARATSPGETAARVDESHLAELEQRVGRLTEQVSLEREARRAAELLAAHGAHHEQGDAGKLKQDLATKESEVMRLEGRARASESEAREMRDAVVSARSGLEELLGTVTLRGDAPMAERIGALLRTLSRF